MPHPGDRAHRDSAFPPEYSEFSPPTSATSSQFPDLPTYSDIFGDPEEQVPAGAPPTQHDHILQGGVLKNNKPWVVLHIQTRPSSTPHTVPRLYGSDNVAGTIDLKLDQPHIVSSITLVLKGRIITSFTEGGSYPFLEYSHNVWNKSDGDPRRSSIGTKFDGRLSGDIEFPFSFPFPTEINLESRAVTKGNRASRPPVVTFTPQTFLERNLKANIEYELVLTISHGILRTNSKIKAPIIFIPRIAPDPPSEKRQSAYLEGSYLPLPPRDPEGWVALPKVSVTGVFQKQRDVALELTLHLAYPLCYTRGSVIPCYLVLSSMDSRALELLFNPKMQYVRLARRIRFFEDPGKGIEQKLQGKEPNIIEEVDEAELAVWWVPPKDIPQEDYTKRLEGEIHLAKDLPPSSDFIPFIIEYAVEILPFDTHIFKCSNLRRSDDDAGSSSKVLLSHPVTVATLKGSGPSPVPFTKRQRATMSRKRPKRDDVDELGALRRYGTSFGAYSPLG